MYKELRVSTSIQSNGNYAADIEAFDQIETQANMMVDSMANGIF
jgi:hypothetical protein